MPDQPVPARVQELAKQVSGKPLSWREEETFVVIVFEDGRKITFDRIQASAQSAASAPPPTDEVPKTNQKKGKGK